MPKSFRIAVVINLDWTLKHHQEVFGGIQSYATEKGWGSVLWPFAPEVVDKKGKRLYDGIVGRVHPELAERAQKARIPLVNVWASSPCKEVPKVIPDLNQSGWMAAEHLRSRGFRRLAYVGYSRTRSSQLQLQGFRKVVREHGLKFSTLHVSSSFSESSRSWSRFQEQIREWLGKQETPLGINTINDKVARYLINAATEMGYEVPRDVAVIGLENEELVCLNPEPSLSSIDLGWHQIGEQAAQLLEKMMNRRKPPKSPTLVPPVSLVPRKSTDAFEVDDEIVAKALRFIAEESHRPIKVRDVVAEVPLSWRSLERRFQEYRGNTIGKEITRFRIERAKRLLVETDLLVKQVAEESGFANTRRLCEVFRRVENLTPEEYRHQRK